MPRIREVFSQAAVNYAGLLSGLQWEELQLGRKLKEITIKMLERCNCTAYQICIKILHDQLPTITQGIVKLTSKYKTL